MKALEILAVEGLPEVQPGDDLGGLIAGRCRLLDGDILVIAQKVVSKAEGRLRALTTVELGPQAVELARRLDGDPRLVQVVLDESVRLVRTDRVLIVETRQGFVCANAGVDHSNVPGDDNVTLLPVDPDASAAGLRERLRELTGADLGVVIADTFGRPWRSVSRTSHSASPAYPLSSTTVGSRMTGGRSCGRRWWRSPTSWLRRPSWSWARPPACPPP